MRDAVPDLPARQPQGEETSDEVRRPLTRTPPQTRTLARTLARSRSRSLTLANQVRRLHGRAEGDLHRARDLRQG